MTFILEFVTRHLAVIILFASTLTSQAWASPPVVVHLADGRTYTAGVAKHSDAQRLWLSFATRSSELLRPIDWTRIVRAESNGESLSGEEFRQRVLNAPKPEVVSKRPTKDVPIEVQKRDAEHQGTLADEALQTLFAPLKTNQIVRSR